MILSSNKKTESQLLQFANQKVRELEAKLADALVRIDILENQNKELNQIISKFAWSHDSVDDKWLARTSTSCSVRNEELSERQSAVTRNKSKSVIDDMILRNLRIFKEDIQLTNMVGKGSFGVVWKANYLDQVVAVKVFISKDIDVNREVNTMAKVQGQPHVLDLIGVVIEEEDPYKPPQVALVMKFMANGSLQDICYNRSSQHMALSNTTKIRFCHQTAKGVLNLHRTNIIHRDLACRNLLVDDHMDVFVADFGFARLKQISSSKDQTLTRVGPIRWEAPEALEFKVYSEKTDSFSFGVCMYEIATGNEPWPRCTTSAMVILNVLKGNRMHFPINCDPVIVELAMQCWAHRPEARPDFTSIVDRLGQRLREVDEDERLVQHEIRTVEYMISGANVLKYPFVVKEGVKGKRPQQRFIRLTSDLKSLLWRSSTANTVFSSARSKTIERGVNMSDVLDVVEGQVTDNFRMFSSASNHHANSISFSLRTIDRTVDIQCESTGERNLWVWGLRFLMSRLKPNARLQEVRIRVEETFFSDTDEALRDHLTAMRYLAYWLQRGEIMIKYTSRKTHARHVCLSEDLTEVLWSSEEDGPVRKGRNKSINLNDIHNIILGVQPRLMTGSARVAAAASQLSEKLTFFRHNAVTSLTASNLSHKDNSSVSHRGSRPSSVETDEASFVQKAPKPVTSKKDQRRLSMKSIGSVEEMMRPVSAAFAPPLPMLKRNVTEETHSSVDSTVGSEAYHDESDYQLCVSYMGVDGRTLLALRCPNDDVLKLWSDGLAKLMSALRRSKEDNVPQYNSASDLTASSVDAGSKWLSVMEHGVVVTPPPASGHHSVSAAIAEESGDEVDDDDEQAARKGQEVYGTYEPEKHGEDNESVSSASTVHAADGLILDNPPPPPDVERDVSSDSVSTAPRMLSTRSIHGSGVTQYEEGGKLMQGRHGVTFIANPPGGEYVAMQRSVSVKERSDGDSKESEASQTPLRVRPRGQSEGLGLESSVSVSGDQKLEGGVRTGRQRVGSEICESPYVLMSNVTTLQSTVNGGDICTDTTERDDN